MVIRHAFLQPTRIILSKPRVLIANLHFERIVTEDLNLILLLDLDCSEVSTVTSSLQNYLVKRNCLDNCLYFFTIAIIWTFFRKLKIEIIEQLRDMYSLNNYKKKSTPLKTPRVTK